MCDLCCSITLYNSTVHCLYTQKISVNFATISRGVSVGVEEFVIALVWSLAGERPEQLINHLASNSPVQGSSDWPHLLTSHHSHISSSNQVNQITSDIAHIYLYMYISGKGVDIITRVYRTRVIVEHLWSCSSHA